MKSTDVHKLKNRQVNIKDLVKTLKQAELISRKHGMLEFQLFRVLEFVNIIVNLVINCRWWYTIKEFVIKPVFGC